MLRFFRVKKDVKGVNPLNDAKNTYYEEVSAGGLQPNERALKVCYQNGDVWEARNLTTESTQVEINKIFNSTLYEFNGFFIIKNKNDTASREYFCFITVDKTNEIKEDKYWLIWLTVYYDLDGSTGFKILLRWDLEQFIFTVVKNPIQINLLENDDFNKEENHYSLPTVAVIRKWYYYKEWLEINTPNKENKSFLNAVPVSIPNEYIEIPLPTEIQIRQKIRERIGKTDKEYDLLSMDFGRQAGHNGYNSCIISLKDTINNYDSMKALFGKAWLSYLGNPYDDIQSNLSPSLPQSLHFKILDQNGKVIKHPLNPDVNLWIRNVANVNEFSDYNLYYPIKIETFNGISKGAQLITESLNVPYWKLDKTWNLMGIIDSVLSVKCKTANRAYLYPPFVIFEHAVREGVDAGAFHKLKWMPEFQPLGNGYMHEGDYDSLSSVFFIYQQQLNDFIDKPTDEAFYMPIWDKLFFTMKPIYTTKGDPISGLTNYYQVRDTIKAYYGYNSHLQLKYLIGYWKARS